VDNKEKIMWFSKSAWEHSKINVEQKQKQVYICTKGENKNEYIMYDV
jgi:hypothetical protein